MNAQAAIRQRHTPNEVGTTQPSTEQIVEAFNEPVVVGKYVPPGNLSNDSLRLR